MSSWTLLVAAYALVWAFVFAYVARLARRQERLRREVEALRSFLVDQGAAKTGR
jgi:CcmD family protein